MRLARAGGLAVALPIVALFVAGVAVEHAQLRAVCAAEPCRGEQLSAASARALQGAGLSPGGYAAYETGITVLFAAVWFGLAALLAWRKSADRMALAAALVFVLFGASVYTPLDALAPEGSAWGRAAHFVNLIGFFSLFVLLYLFPDGRFVPRWTRWSAAALLPLALGNAFFPGSPVDPATWGLGQGFSAWFFVSSIGAQIYRYRRESGPTARQQTRWVVLGIAAMLGAITAIGLLRALVPPFNRPDSLAVTLFGPIEPLPLLLVPLAIGGAILRHRLYDIDILINRTLVYGGLTASVIGLYTLVVGGLGTLFQTRGSLVVSLVATSLVAVLFQPLRAWLQRGVNRLLYGERDDPYAVLSRLGQRLEGTLAPDAVLPTIVQTVREALKLPYAALALKQHGDFAIATSAGTAVADPLRLPLIYQHETVGELLLAPRAPGEAFGPADHRLLDDLARQAGVAVHAVRLTADLQRARERLVTAREEERRRLRRDLHDGLGPRLGAQMLKVGAARLLYRTDPAAGDATLAELEDDLEAALADIRRLVYNLRPPALDELGLVGAIREAAAQYDRPRSADGAQGVRISVDAPEPLPTLPAAVEVAAYRIAQEALTNVVRHAGARSCGVRLRYADAALTLEVRDDGRGLPLAGDGGRRAGVGLHSMRERAEELGGTCAIEPGATGGACVRARLPCA